MKRAVASLHQRFQSDTKHNNNNNNRSEPKLATNEPSLVSKSEFSSRGARPPVPGSELGAAVFNETKTVIDGGFSEETHRRVNGGGGMGQGDFDLEDLKAALPASVTGGSTMTPSPKPSEPTDLLRSRGFEPEGSADITPPFSESNSNNSSTPAYVRWAESLRNLLDDSAGVELYKEYLKTENVGQLLDFWFACQGLKKMSNEENREKIFQLVKVINRTFLRSKKVPINEDTRKEIQDRIAAKTDVRNDIFDTAQIEVEDRMTRTTYQNFLKSEAYLNYVQQMQIGESDFSAKCSGTQSTASSISGRGPVADDSGHFSVPIDAEKSKSGSRSSTSGVPNAPLDPGTNSDSTSGISDTSSIPIVQHNTTAINNSGCDETSESYQMVASMSALPTLHENSELDLTDDRPMSTSQLLPGLTSHSLMYTARKRHSNVKPEAQAGAYLQQGGGRVPHPYHAFNSAYNPVSRQDSELQSLSSDAHTTDDNLSSFTESSSHYSYIRHVTQSKKHLRRQHRKAQEQSRQNRENAHASHSQQAFIPRTARVPAEASNQLPPKEFAAILTKKLEKVKREQELNEKLNRKLAEDTNSMVSDSSRILTDLLQQLPDESDQSILDMHVSRVWKDDKTPLRSPGDPSGRPRSPGAYRRGKPSAQPSLQPPLGAMAPHRTLPGRGHRAQARRMPGQQMYHQDLAYYEVEVDRSRNLDTWTNQDRALDHGNTNKVMEWMQDVERERGQQPDQRSSSSRGPTKTSPRSGRQKGHRSQSQERMLSTSWTGNQASSSYPYPPTAGGGGYPYPPAHHHQQLQEANRRLMMHHSNAAAAHLPPQQFNQPAYGGPHNQSIGGQEMFGGGTHSNNSTLRKSQGGQKPVAAAAGQPSEFTVAVYTFSHEKEPMPYRIRIPTKSVTLKAVKDLLPKKGAFRFFFKTEIDGEACYEEESEDSNLVPLWEGKVLVQCRIME